MSRKIGLNKVQLQSYVLLPENINDCVCDNQKIAIVDGRKIQVCHSATKESLYDFDHVFPINLTQSSDSNVREFNLPSDLMPLLSNAINLVLLGYSSTLLCYCSQSPRRFESSASSVGPLSLSSDPFAQLLQQLSSQLHDLMTDACEYKVELSAFELFDTQLRDLLIPSVAAANYKKDLTTTFHMDTIKIKEENHSDTLFNVQGLFTKECDTQQQFIEAVETVLQRRLFLIARSQTEEKAAVKVAIIKPGGVIDEKCVQVGYVGSTMIQITIHSFQTISVSSKETAGAVSHQHKIHHKSSLNVIWLSTTESLISMMDQFSQSSVPNYCAVTDWSHASAGKFEWLSSSLANGNNSSKTNNTSSLSNMASEFQLRFQQLKNSLKSLSTLIRVISLLVERKNKVAADSLEGFTKDTVSRKLPHIPYRDSLLTRLLKNILDGNCFLTMITILSSGGVKKEAAMIDNIAHTLRFTSEIRKLFNYIWIEEKILWRREDVLQMLDASNSSLAITATASTANSVPPLIKDEKSSDSRIDQLLDAQNQFRREMEQMITELESLEIFRNKLLLDMSQSIAFESVSYRGRSSVEANLSAVSETDSAEDSVVRFLQQSLRAILSEEEKKTSTQISRTNSDLPKLRAESEVDRSENIDTSIEGSMLRKLKVTEEFSPTINLLKPAENRKPRLMSSSLDDSSAISSHPGNGLRDSTKLSSISTIVPSRPSLHKRAQTTSLGQRRNSEVDVRNVNSRLQNSSIEQRAEIELPEAVSSFTSPGEAAVGFDSPEQINSLRTLPPVRGAKELMKEESLLIKRIEPKELLDKEGSYYESRIGLRLPPSAAEGGKDGIVGSHVARNGKPVLPSVSLQNMRNNPPRLHTTHSGSTNNNIKPSNNKGRAISTKEETLNFAAVHGKKSVKSLSSPADSAILPKKDDHSSPRTDSANSYKTTSTMTTTDSSYSKSPRPRNDEPFSKDPSIISATETRKENLVQEVYETSSKVLGLTSKSVVPNELRKDCEIPDAVVTHVQNFGQVRLSTSDDIERADDSLEYADNRESESFDSSFCQSVTDKRKTPSSQSFMKLPAIVSLVAKSISEHEEALIESLHQQEQHQTDPNSTSARKKEAQRDQKRRKERKEEEQEEDLPADDDGLTELERTFLRAVSTGNVNKVYECLNAGVNVHVKNSFERDAMQIAARNGSIQLLQLLFSNGASLSTRGLRGDTLFHLAGYNGHVDTLKWLQRKGILPEAVDLMGQTAIHVAARRGEFKVLKYLYEELHVSGFLQEDFNGLTPLECIPRRGGDSEEYRLCRDYLMMIATIESSSEDDKHS